MRKLTTTKKPKHNKRNKSGHTFKHAVHGRDPCSCGLTLYDWQCKWLWS